MTKVAKIISDRPRHKDIDLEWPIEFDGKTYSAIRLLRLTAGDVAKWSEELSEKIKTDPDASVRLPLFRDVDGNEIPQEVFDAMDTDDRDKVDEEALSFLPRRFRAVTGANTTPTNGEATELS